MVLSQIEKNILESKKQQEVIIGKLNEIAEEVIMELDQFLRDWINEFVKKQVTLENPSFLLEIGNEESGKLKSEIKNMIENLDTKSVLNKDELWIHRREIPSHFIKFEASLESLYVINENVKKMVEQIKNIMTRPIFLLKQKNFYKDDRYIPLKYNGIPTFSQSFEFSKAVKEKWDIYLENLEQLSKETQNESNLMREKNKINAQTLWESL